jgi:hypothetical protein
MTKHLLNRKRAHTPDTLGLTTTIACRLLLLTLITACSSEPLASGDGRSTDGTSADMVAPPVGSTLIVSAAMRKLRMTISSDGRGDSTSRVGWWRSRNDVRGSFRFDG